MYHAKRSGLLSKILLGSALAGSISGCYVTKEDIFGATLDVVGASGAVKSPVLKNVVDKGSELSYRAGERRAKHEIELREADVDIYREKELSNVRVNEEKALRNLENEVSSPSPIPQNLDDKTKAIMEDVLGRKVDVNLKPVIDAVQREYLANPIDYERNIRMIDKALKLEGLGAEDKNRLSEILNNVVDNIEKDGKNERNIESKLKALKYIMNFKEFKNRPYKTRIDIVIMYLGHILKKTGLINNTDEKIKTINEGIKDVEEIKNNIRLVRWEYNILYRGGGKIADRLKHSVCPGLVDIIEKNLRDLLEKKDRNDFSTKLTKLKELVNECKKDLSKTKDIMEQANLMGLAKEIGFSAWLRAELDLDINDQPKK